ncbi:hypothetical protein BAE44_0005305 [Dichanthelium oligosanthes]|uniref:Glabrous enhancer-binding protein-like DBD domain-containing protein n=1 Tax=Dichanthelium oligosanthes TaxID=888268 RepID=A0A1E5W8D3_9POAL|nr:hypothetical protein BAE44_0005305 [Dichanthelium oligosanthes]
MSPERSAAATAETGAGSDASDGKAGATRHSNSPSPIPSGSRSRSRSRSKTPPPDVRPSAAALASTPTAGADAGAGGRASSPRRRDGEDPPRDHLDSDADTGRRAPSPRRRGERSPSSHSDSDAEADAVATAGRASSPRRKSELTPLLDLDSGSDTATAPSEDDGDASPSPRACPSSHIKTSSVKPISTRPMDAPLRADAAASSEPRFKRRHSSPGRGTPEYQKRPPRVWAPEDEVTILTALIEYRAKKGRLPASIQDTGKLHSQISGRLTANASVTQLSDKVRRLKHKCKLLVTRAKNGRDPDLPTEFDRNVYELSKKVWEFKSKKGTSLANEDIGDADSDEEQEIKERYEDMEKEKNREHTGKKPKTFRFENGNGNAIATVGRASHGNGSGRDDAEKGKQMYPYLWAAVEELSKDHPSGQIFRKAFGVLEKSKARAMEEKLRKHRMSVVRQQLHRMDLTKESVGMVLDALDGA